MQYTIEARQLTKEDTIRSAHAEAREVVVEADDVSQAIERFLEQTRSQLVSSHDTPGRETIATVKNGDHVYLVRVY